MTQVRKTKSIYFSRNRSRTQVVTFSLGLKGCDYLKCDTVTIMSEDSNCNLLNDVLEINHTVNHSTAK